MADTKISALPASTTPLAGTEVLPIVQSGVTRQVSVANLTAGRAISATQLTLSSGNLIVASGQGIDFSATPGTGTSELFNDYEEGTWTPVDASGTLGVPLAFAVGNYSKIGRMVFASFMITYPATVDTNNASVGGLPFSSMSGNQTGGSAITYTDFGAFISVINGAGASTMLLCNASAAVLTNANMSGKIIRGTLSYMV